MRIKQMLSMFGHGGKPQLPALNQRSGLAFEGMAAFYVKNFDIFKRFCI